MAERTPVPALHLTRSEATQPTDSVWLSHHDPDDYERCVVVGRTHVCRRCLLLYPLALAVLVAARSGLRPSTPVAAVLLALLPVPAVVEFVLEHLDVVGYQPRRQLTVTAPLAFAVGVGLDRYLRRQTDPLFWAMTLGYGSVCFAALIVGGRRRRREMLNSTDP
jgi:hypothetical protein